MSRALSPRSFFSPFLAPSLALALTLFFPLLAIAETPSEFVQKIIHEMKTKKSASAVADFIHWPTAYASLTDVQKKTMEVNSPQALESYVRKLLASPSKTMRSMLEKRLSALGSDAKKNASQAIDGMVKEIEQQERDLVGKIERAEYKIGSVTENGNSAKVQLSTMIDGTTSTDTIQLSKIDGKWYLPTVNAMNTGSTVGDAGSAMK